MSGRIFKYIIISVLLALSVNGYLFAQDRSVISWEPVDGAGGYILEIRNSQKKIITEKELADTSYDISKLTPGSYQYRLTTLNKLKRKGKSTEWVNFFIEKAVIPVLKDVSRKVLSNTSDNPPFYVTGENFTGDTKLYLKKDSESIELDTSFISGSELKAVFKTEKKSVGLYDLVAVNRGGFESVIKSAVEINDTVIPVVKNIQDNTALNNTSENRVTEQTPAVSTGLTGMSRLALGAGWDLTVPAGDWSSNLDISLTGFHLYLSYPLSNFPTLNNISVLKNSGIECLFSYTGYSFTKGKDSESFSMTGCYAGINYSAFPGFLPPEMSLIFNIDAGAAYSSMTIFFDEKLSDFSSLDFSMKCGLALRYEFIKNFFTDLSAGYTGVFYLSHPLSEVTVSICAGLML